jgi:signal transduction histidine kinase
MRAPFDTIKARVVAILLVFLSLSHVIGLWLYVQKSEEATTLLHDALLAEQIALVTRLAERLPPADRAPMLSALSGPTVRMTETPVAELGPALPEGSRGHAFEHLLGVFLDRPTHETIRLAYLPGGQVPGLDNLLGTVRASAHSQTDHLPTRPLAEIRPLGAMTAEVRLSDGSWIRFVAPLLTVTPFSPLKLGAPLTAMIASVLLIAAWVLNRWTQPLTRFAAAAERFGTDIHAPPLAERGPYEVRAATRTLNVMQERIRRLVEDRTAFAAAIAHDLGTPITRLHLRAHEIEEESTRTRIIADLEQMQRMITATLEFARLDFTAEPSETIDVTSLVQSLCDDFTDSGQEVALTRLDPATIRSKPMALRRALSNVVDNAVKYGTRARVSLVSNAHDIRFVVEDDGPGIPDSQFEAAFQPFRRLGATDPTKGTGLGLTIARSIVRALGGEISLTNRPSGGLCVTLMLPVVHAAAAP